MIKLIAGFKWNTFSGKLRSLWGKNGDSETAALTSLAEEQRQSNITILQERYGYSHEKAAAEHEKHYSKIRLAG